MNESVLIMEALRYSFYLRGFRIVILINRHLKHTDRFVCPVRELMKVQK
jgi:creatinine amidohydrolase/Fe(II)-dependent formamide hydrolase-like protein